MTTSAPALAPLDPTVPRVRWTVGQVYRALDAGLFDNYKFELLHGEIVDLMSHNPKHANAFARFFRWLATFVAFERIRSEKPITLLGSDAELSEPQPDIVVCSTNPEQLETRHPLASEVQLIVEIADSSLLKDSTTKRDLYARSGIPEYWLLDLNARTLTIHRKPQLGVYTLTAIHSEGETVSPLFSPVNPVEVSSLFS